MSPKVLLILLVVIALLAVMVIATGFRPGRPTSKNYQRDSAFSGLDKLLSRFRDPFVVGRMSGCNGDGHTLTIPSGGCTVQIGHGDATSSAFKLAPTAGNVTACYGFEPDQLTDCIDGDADKRSRVESNGTRFVVGKDGAILRLYCTPVSGSACTLRIILEE